MGTNSAPDFPYPGGVSGAEPSDPVPGKPGHFAWSRWVKQFVKNLNTNLQAHEDSTNPHPNWDVGGGSIGVAPPGGLTGQVLSKASDADYDVEWATVTGGGGGAPGTDLPADMTFTLTPGTTVFSPRVTLASGSLATVTWRDTANDAVIGTGRNPDLNVAGISTVQMLVSVGVDMVALNLGFDSTSAPSPDALQLADHPGQPVRSVSGLISPVNLRYFTAAGSDLVGTISFADMDDLSHVELPNTAVGNVVFANNPTMVRLNLTGAVGTRTIDLNPIRSTLREFHASNAGTLTLTTLTSDITLRRYNTTGTTVTGRIDTPLMPAIEDYRCAGTGVLHVPHTLMNGVVTGFTSLQYTGGTGTGVGTLLDVSGCILTGVQSSAGRQFAFMDFRKSGLTAVLVDQVLNNAVLSNVTGCSLQLHYNVGPTPAGVADANTLRGRGWTVDHEVSTGPATLVLVQNEATFTPWITLYAGSPTTTVTWTDSVGNVLATGLQPTITFESQAVREIHMTVDNSENVEVINFGFDNNDDTGRYSLGTGYNWPKMRVRSVSGVQKFSRLRVFCCASTIPVPAIDKLAGSVDVRGLRALEYFETAYSKVSEVLFARCDGLIRLCLEENGWGGRTIDLNEVSATLRDLRMAGQGGVVFAPLTNGRVMQNEYHYCTRAQPVTNMFTHYDMPNCEEYWVWACNQTGTLTVGPKMYSVPVEDNLYDAINYITPGNNAVVTGSLLSVQRSPIRSITGMATGKHHEALYFNGCTMPQTLVDQILATVNGWGYSVGGQVGTGAIVDLTGNASPSAQGLADRAALTSRGWTVNVFNSTVGVSGLTSNPTNTRITLTWTLPAGANNAIVRRATGSVAPATPTDGVGMTVTNGGTRVDDDGVTTGSEYSYAVFPSVSGVTGVGSYGAATNVTVTAETPLVYQNVGPLATATSSGSWSGQGPDKAINGVISGHPYDSQQEWALFVTTGWIELTWASPVTIDKVTLYDRPNTADNITGGTLTFSSGAAVSVGALPNGWTLASPSGLEVTFTERTVTWMRFTVDTALAGSTSSGLAELQVWGTPS